MRIRGELKKENQGGAGVQLVQICLDGRTEDSIHCALHNSL